MAFDAEGKLLLGKRRDNGLWTVPAGHLEHGEFPEDGAVREMFEESGLKAKSLSYLTTYEYQGTPLHCFTALVDGEPTPKNDPDQEVSEWKWIDVSEGIPKNIWNHLHGPLHDENLLSRVFDMRKAEAETLQKYDTPEFQQWFSGSHVATPEGKPLRVYHGTSKDKDFGTFKIGARGAWFTSDPHDASTYAKENDSQGVKLDRYTGKYQSLNTTPRVIPAHLSLKNPYRVTQADHDAMNVQNYGRAEGQFFNQLRARGHDGAIMPDGKTFVAFHPHQIKSIFNARPTLHPHMSKSEGDLAPAAASALLGHPDASHLANLAPEHFKAAVKGGVSIPMYRGHDGSSPDPEVAWHASRPQTAANYAKGPGGVVQFRHVTLRNPYVATSTEILNATNGMVNRLRAAGHDGIVAQWGGGVQWPGAPKPEREIWSVPFRPVPGVSKNDTFHLEALIRVGEDLADLQKDEGEVSKLLRHPDPRERSMALKMRGAQPHHLQLAMSDPDPLVWHAAVTHPKLEDQLLHYLVSTKTDSAGNSMWERHKVAMRHPKFERHHLQHLFETHHADGDHVKLDHILEHRHAKGLLDAELKADSAVLAKATDPNHLKGIGDATSEEGSKMVDYKPDLTAHPASHQSLVDAYKGFQQSKTVHKPFTARGDLHAGETKKVTYRVPVPGQKQSSIFMVKPYHEQTPPDMRWWTRHPTAGWGEMTSQALYHAGGIGHLHQRVHVAEHDMGTHGTQPALAIHIEPGFEPAADSVATLEQAKHPDRRTDLRKIVAMDFLANNLDRHGGNLLLHRDGRHMAIDNSRSYQYRIAHAHRRNEGGIDELDTLPGPVFDNFGDYHKRSYADWYDPLRGEHPVSSPEAKTAPQTDYAPVFKWWGQVGPSVRQAFHRRLNQIKDPAMRAHLRRNFDERADWMDAQAANGLEAGGLDWHKQPVRLYRPHERREDEIIKSLGNLRDRLREARA